MRNVKPHRHCDGQLGFGGVYGFLSCRFNDIEEAGIEDRILRKGVIDLYEFYLVVCYFQAIPWFVSDVTQKDFAWVINQLMRSYDPVLSKLGARWQKFVTDVRF